VHCVVFAHDYAATPPRRHAATPFGFGFTRLRGEHFPKI
jgi:hypothetical protein